MSSGYLVWRFGSMRDGICKLKGLKGVKDAFEIDDGVSRAEGWPDDASSVMNPNFPKDIGLADTLTGAGYMVISAKVKELLEAERAGKAEYLPLKIINHKGRVESDAYFVLNPLEIVDCIDQAASEVELDTLDKGMISGCEQLVLREDVIPKDLKVFRVGLWSGLILIRRDVATKMKAAGLTGLRFFEPEDYNGLT